MSITCIPYPAPGGGRTKNLLVMLPGAGMQAEDFAANGMVAAVHGCGLDVDIIAARPELDLYLDGEVAAALHGAVIAPALAQGYARIWLLGVSLGGMGALLYAAAHEKHVAGIFLLAPFLGTPGTIAEVEAAGGLAAGRLAAWQPGGIATAPEAVMLGWLQDVLRRRQGAPKLYLGYGTKDRFSRGHRLLGACLGEEQKFTQEGGHEWATWLALWRRMLDEVAW